MLKVRYLSCVLFVFLVSIFTVSAQTYIPTWALGFDGNDPSWAGVNTANVAVSVSDGFLVGGSQNQHLFKGRNGDTVSTGRTASGGAYIAKFDYSGNLKWVDYAVGQYYTNGNVANHVTAIATDEKENIYICGKSFPGTGLFYYNNGNAVTDLSRHDSTKPAYSAYFVAKLDKNGNVLWHTSVSGEIVDMTYDHHGKLVLVGDFYRGVNYYLRQQDTVKTLDSFYSYNQIMQYVYWIDTTGKLSKWSMIVTGGPNNLGVLKVTSDSSANIFLTGAFEHDLTTYDKNLVIGKYINSVSGLLGSKFFMSKYDSTGTPVWNVFDRVALNDVEGSRPVETRIDKKGNIYCAVYANEFYLSDSMYFFNADSSIRKIAKRAYSLYCISNNGFLKWQATGGFRMPSGLLVQDSMIVVAGVNRDLYNANYYMPAQNDTFYSATGSKKYWMAHQSPNPAIAYYDTLGNIIKAERYANNIKNNTSGVAQDPTFRLTRGDSTSYILYGDALADSVMYFRDTISVNGTDAIIAKVTPFISDTIKTPKAPPRVYIDKDMPELICSPDTFVLRDTVLAPFDTSNVFTVELFDYKTFGGINKNIIASVKSTGIDSIVCIVPAGLPNDKYGIRIHASWPGHYSQIREIEVSKYMQPLVEIAVSPDTIVKVNTTVTFTAWPSYVGRSPEYKWFVNNSVVQVGSSRTYITDSLRNGDVVRVLLKSDYKCRTIDSVYSSPQQMHVGIADVMKGNENILIAPNPTTGEIFLKAASGVEMFGVNCFDMMGRKLCSASLKGGKDYAHVTLPVGFAGNVIIEVETNKGYLRKIITVL